MKNTFLLLVLLLFLAGCTHQALSPEESATKYYSTFDSGNFNELKTVINDSITIVSGDYTTTYSQKDFYQFFKWDSIFKPAYEILELDQKDGNIIVTGTQKNMRNKFLKNNPLLFKQKISFNSGKISTIEDINIEGPNWAVWSKQRDSLVDWTKIHHPELDGFIYDLTMQGAQNYLKAIKLYEADKSAF